MYPRQANSNGNFKKFSIYTKAQGEGEYHKFGEYDDSEDDFEYPIVIDFPDSFKKPEAIKLKVEDGNSGVVSLGEIEFYKNNQLMGEYLELFEDKSATKLKPEVTKENIEDFDNEFIREMAMAIHDEVYDDFRIGKFKSYPDPNKIAQENKTNTYGFYDNVTGIFVKKFSDLILFADDFEGKISLRIVDHKAGFDGESYMLQPGINRFEVETEGLAYIIYQDDEDKEVKVNFATGKNNGYFDITQHTNEDWEELLDDAQYAYFDVLGEKAMLSFTTDDFREYTDDIEELIDLFDTMVEWEDDFIGLYKYDRVPKTRAYYRTNSHDPKMYMYATTYRTEYNVDVMNKLTITDEVRTNPWGVAHELGHTHQTQGLNWTGLGEVSNNIYTQYVQTEFDNQANLQSSGGGDDYENSYSKGFSESINKEAHATIEDGMVKLIPFWQLQIYFDKVVDKPDFYKDVHEYLRTHDVPSDPAQQQVDFVKIASEAGGLDLSGFFEAWGFLTPMNEEIEDYTSAQFEVTQNMVDEAKDYTAQYPKPNEDIAYLTDDKIDVYKSKGTVKAGQGSVSGDDIDIEGSENAVAFQQERNDEVKYIAVSSSFTVKDYQDGDKLYAIGYDGEKKEVQID